MLPGFAIDIINIDKMTSKKMLKTKKSNEHVKALQHMIEHWPPYTMVYHLERRICIKTNLEYRDNNKNV